jgi:DNA polymerase (family 10)
MPIHHSDIADHFNRVAGLLEIEGSKKRGCFLVLNAHPDRLDLSDVFCKMVGDMGVKIAVSTDAHRTDNLDYMHRGIGQVRRGWLEAKDVLNTRSCEQLKKLLKRSAVQRFPV